MATLCDWQIEQLCIERGLVHPFDPNLINPASIDIRVGELILLPDSEPGVWIHTCIKDYSKEAPYMVKPFQFLLAESLETFYFPDNICGQFILKSSRGREGWQHCLAGFCDPGWNGSKLTMELYNVSRWDLPIYPELRIGQIEFRRMDAGPARSYAETGRYNNDKTVKSSKG